MKKTKINEYLQYLNEGYIFSDKTLSVNLDKFESKKNKKLLIIGPCGSGKSTIGRKLSKKYNVPLIEVDKLFQDRDKQIEVMHKKLIKLLYNNEKLIIEGVHWLEIYLQYPIHRPTMLKQSIIILGLSSIRAGLRAGLRNNEYKKDKTRWYKTFKMIQTNFKYIEKPLKMLRKDVKNIAMEYKHEKGR